MEQNYPVNPEIPVPPAAPERPAKKPIFKKWWFWVLLVVVLAVIVGAVSGGKKAPDDGKKEIVTDENGETVSVSGNAEEGRTDEGNTEKPAGKTTVEEQVLWNTDELTLTLKSYESDSIWGDSLKILVENKSDKTMHVGCDALIVNDYMILDLFSAEVAPEKKANETLSLSSSELKAAGIDNVGKIELYFYSYADGNFTDRIKSDCVTVKTSKFDEMDVTPNDAGTELYNADGVRIVGKYVDDKSFWGAAVLLYIENTSGKNVTVTADELSVNGFMITEYFVSTVYDGKRAIDDMTLSATDLKENGIDSIEEIELKFVIREEGDYLHSVTTDPIKFKVK